MPVIIGGWAVYSYIPKIGSIDIDVVLKKKDIGKLGKFFIEEGYERKEDEQNMYCREIKLHSGKTETIRFDIIEFEHEYPIMRAPKVKIPVRLVKDFSEERNFQGQKIRVPSKELLLVQKVAAYRNREDIARTGHLKLPIGQREWNERKIAKDKEDIRNLVESGIDYDKLENLLEKTGFKKIYLESLKEIGIIKEK